MHDILILFEKNLANGLQCKHVFQIIYCTYLSDVKNISMNTVFFCVWLFKFVYV